MKAVLGKFFFVLLALGFTLPLLVMFPLFWILLRKEAWHPMALWLNRIWAFFVFFFPAIYVKSIWEQDYEVTKPHILVANHFSYLDIPVIGLCWWKVKFMGKSSLGKFPVFGYIYTRLHIMVDRANRRSRGESLVKMKETLRSGISVAIFPEGGIRSKSKPQMVDFKDGAFTSALDLGLPIVPVSMPYNYQALDDPGKIFVNWRTLKVTFHKALYPEDFQGEGGLERMKQAAFKTIQNSLDADHETR